MDNNNTKTIGNRHGLIRKPAVAGGQYSAPRYSPKRPHSHHGLLKGPYFPQVNNVPATRTAT